MSSRDINDLCHELQLKFYAFQAACNRVGVSFIVTCTYRSPQEQTALYTQGRTKPGKIVTYAKAGQSEHNAVDETGQPASRAFDIVIMVAGKPEWTGKHPHWELAGKIGVDLGLEWGYNWKKFKEMPHFQLKKET